MNNRAFRVSIIAVILIAAASAAFAADNYYKVKPIFIPYPQPGKSWSIRQYGPVGMSINLINPAFTVQITGIEPGSPAEATAKLKKGQIVESINGQTLKDIDPRVQLAKILTEAEATDGLMRFKIKGEGTVTVRLPVMGRYSKTWPLNCPKTDKIIRNFGDRATKLEKPDWAAGPFLLSTGETRDLETFRRWLKGGMPKMTYPWHIGYRGTAFCEYFLRTGDESVLPGIKRYCDELNSSMYNGSWMGRGSKSPNFGYMAGGHMNAAGVHALNFLILAKECGVAVDDYLLKRVLFQFFRFGGRGNVAYGDQMPEGGFRDNGKSGGLAVAMSSAASLDPRGESSIYAKMRDNSAMKSFYATSWFNRAHTGGGIGEIWHGVAMQLMAEKKPLQWRSFNDERLWFYELSRCFDGSFKISDNGGSYASVEWGNHFAMFYTASRKKLRMFGAPKTKYCRTYSLPRPWGNAADDKYQSLKSAEVKPGKFLDTSKETIPTDASAVWMAKFGPDASDAKLYTYAHHPEYAYRSGIARAIAKEGRTKLIVPLLKHKDPRMREVGVLTMAGMFKGKPIAVEAITDEMYSLLASMIKDPEESHWVQLNAMNALKRLPEEKILPLTDRLLELMKIDCWWMESAALGPLSKVAANPAVYRKVIPAIGEVAANNTECCTFGSTRALAGQIAAAKPEAQKLALSVFTRAHNDLPDPMIAPGGANMATGLRGFKGTIRGWIQAAPGGKEMMSKVPRLTSAWQKSKRDSDKYVYSGTFRPNSKLAGKWKAIAKAKSIEDLKAQFAKQAQQAAKEKAAREKAKKQGKKYKPRPKKKSKVEWLTLDANGRMGRSKTRTWSGNMIIDQGKGEALKMELHNVNGRECLFVERGGFSATHPPEWHCGYQVYER